MRAFDLPVGAHVPVDSILKQWTGPAPDCLLDKRLRGGRACTMAGSTDFRVIEGRICREFRCTAADGCSGVAWLPNASFVLIRELQK